MRQDHGTPDSGSFDHACLDVFSRCGYHSPMKHTQKTKDLLRKIRTTHGCSKPSGGLRYRTWLAWRMMFQRCENPNHKSYMQYGGRGIVVVKRWHEFSNFFADMGVKPEGTTLGRIDNNKGYMPSNCEWQTPKEQCNNRSNNTRLCFHGITKTLQEWADTLEIPRDVVGHRLKSGWSVEDALGKPMKKQHNSRVY